MSRKPIVITLALLGTIILCVLLVFLFLDDLILTGFFDYFEDKLVTVAGMNRWLAKALALLFILPLVWALPKGWSLHSDQRQKGRAVLITTTAVFFLMLFALGMAVMFDSQTGRPLKFYSETPDGFQFFDHPGFDPYSGQPLRPVTIEVIQQDQARKLGLVPKQLPDSAATELDAFDRIGGTPKFWYDRSSEGVITLYDKRGKSPATGEPLKPITNAVIQEFKRQINQRSMATAVDNRLARIERYVRKPILDQQGKTGRVVAIILVQATGQIDLGMASDVCGSLRTNGINGLPNLLRQGFVDDKLFARLIQGGFEDLRDLELSHSCNYLLAGTIAFSDRTNSALPDVVTVVGTIDVIVVDIHHLTIADRFSLSATGAGFTKDAAREKSTTDLTKELGSKTLAFLEKLP